MAEGMLRAWGDDRYEALSAGTEATEVRPQAIRVMQEIGIDITGQSSKAVQSFEGQDFDYAATVCGDAKEACPHSPGAARQLHWSFEDPSAAEGTEEKRLGVFRSVRDQIADRLRAEFAV
jgi:arsenate reductase